MCAFVMNLLAAMLQELSGKLKIVKVEADPNPGLVEKYKVCLCQLESIM